MSEKDDLAWLSTVEKILAPPLRREYLARMRSVRANAALHAWKGRDADSTRA